MKSQLVSLLVLAAAFFLFMGCDNPAANDDSSEGGEIIAGNGHAVLDGEDFGGGSTDVSLLRKEIEVTISSLSDPRLSAPEKVYAMRNSDLSSALYLAIPVTNVSDEPVIGVDASDMFLRDGNGDKTHASALSASFRGSVAQNESGYERNTALAPGETGYVFEIETGEYETTAGVSLTLTCSGIAHAGSSELSPSQYEADRTTLRVHAENTGSKKIDVSDYFYWLGLDANGDPVIWSLDNENQNPATGVVSPGDAYSVDETSIYYDGTIAKIAVFFDFDTFTESSSVSGLAARESIAPRRKDESHDEYVSRVHSALTAAQRSAQ